eukprot:TRINITY_DN10208_c1_g1_i1.p1 TRINITY_DN10208_c1_g1~~TRINITY_DN10208_c1_g1_i1.p1  ORF type:complete len:557 (+),score=62.76 TRINITY_DN10208_c1_g1_i1:183-1853(+)
MVRVRTVAALLLAIPTCYVVLFSHGLESPPYSPEVYRAAQVRTEQTKKRYDALVRAFAEDSRMGEALLRDSYQVARNAVSTHVMPSGIRLSAETRRDSGSMGHFLLRGKRCAECACAGCTAKASDHFRGSSCDADDEPVRTECPAAGSGDRPDSALLSAHSCYSRDLSAMHWTRATCMFKNVHVANGVLVYVVRDSCRKRRLLHQQDLQVTTGVGSHRYNPRLQIKPRVLTIREFKEEYGTPNRSTLVGTHVLYHQGNSGTLAGVVFSQLLPVLSALSAFNLSADSSVTLVRHTYTGATTDVAGSVHALRTAGMQDYAAEYERRCSDLSRLLSMAGAITDYGALFQGSGNMVSVGTLIVGLGVLSDKCNGDLPQSATSEADTHCLSGRDMDFWHLRRRMLTHLHLEVWSPPQPAVSVHAELKAYKSVVRSLATNAPSGVRLHTVNVHDDHRMPESLAEAARVLSQSCVLVADGRPLSSVLALWLPRGATLVRLHSSATEFGAEWSPVAHMSHIQVEYVLATADEGSILRLLVDGLLRCTSSEGVGWSVSDAGIVSQ